LIIDGVGRTTFKGDLEAAVRGQIVIFGAASGPAGPASPNAFMPKALTVSALILAAAARRLGAPYPVFPALGGAPLAFLPCASSFSVPPELALALFVAPVLLDAAYDASLRDLRDNWAPVTSLVVFAVGFTTAAIAVVAHTLIPTMPWAVSIALGAVVAPPTQWRPLRCSVSCARPIAF
jgi:hypothetical protein